LQFDRETKWWPVERRKKTYSKPSVRVRKILGKKGKKRYYLEGATSLEGDQDTFSGRKKRVLVKKRR